MPVIISITVAGPESKARRLSFDDTTERTTSAAVVKALGLEVGASIDEGALLECESDFARERALRVLGYRERSESELRQKLLDSGYSREVADPVVSRMVELNMVDDLRFAAMWTRSRISAGYGSRRIQKELSARGVSAETIAAAFESFEDRDEVDAAVAALRGRVPTGAKERERLLRALVTRGYSVGVALEALNRIESTVDGGRDCRSDQR